MLHPNWRAAMPQVDHPPRYARPGRPLADLWPPGTSFVTTFALAIRAFVGEPIDAVPLRLRRARLIRQTAADQQAGRAVAGAQSEYPFEERHRPRPVSRPVC